MPHLVRNSGTAPDEQRSACARQKRADSGKIRALLVGEDRDQDHDHRDAANDVLQHKVSQHRKTFDRYRAADQKFPGPRRAHEERIFGGPGCDQPDAERERGAADDGQCDRQRRSFAI